MLSLTHRMIAPQWLAANRIVVFEDETTTNNLFPLNVLRPSWEIRAGLGSLRELLSPLRAAGYSISLRPRENLLEHSKQLAGWDDLWQDTGDSVIFLNGRLLALPEYAGEMPAAVVDSQGEILWAKLDGKDISRFSYLPGTELAKSLVKQVDGVAQIREIGGVAAQFIWDYMAENEGLLKRAFAGCDKSLWGSSQLLLPPGVTGIGPHPVYAGEESHILPSVVLDTTDGPIWLGQHVTIEPHCYIKGPLALGDFGKVKAGAVLYTCSSFGPHCRISGEISNSIMQGYCNKQHAGFLGNSHLGEWVNLGADTVVSNLRNDYGPVKLKLNQKLVDSGRQFVGLMCGDHTKTGINTMFNTGSVVGVGANVYGGGYPPRFIRSFSWGGKDGFHLEPLDRTLESARIAAGRRGREISAAEVKLLTDHYASIA